MQDLYYRYDIVAYTLIADIACNALKMRCTAFLCVGSIVIFLECMRVVELVKGLICDIRDNRIGIDGKSGLLAGDICYLL